MQRQQFLLCLGVLFCCIILAVDAHGDGAAAYRERTPRLRTTIKINEGVEADPLADSSSQYQSSNSQNSYSYGGGGGGAYGNYALSPVEASGPESILSQEGACFSMEHERLALVDCSHVVRDDLCMGYRVVHFFILACVAKVLASHVVPFRSLLKISFCHSFRHSLNLCLFKNATRKLSVPYATPELLGCVCVRAFARPCQ